MLPESLIRIMLKINPNIVANYKGRNIDIYLEALEKGYEMTNTQIRKFSNKDDDMKKILKIRPDYIKYYIGYNANIYIEAIKAGYELSENQIENVIYEDINGFKEILKVRPDYVKYYHGSDISVYLEAINLGYEIEEEQFNKIRKRIDNEIVSQILEVAPHYIKYCHGNASNKEYISAIKGGYKITEEELKKFEANDIVMIALIKQDFHYIKSYTGDNISVYLEALKNKEYEMTKEELWHFMWSDSFKEILKLRPNYIEYYESSNESFYEEAINNGYELTEERIKKLSKSETVMNKALEKDVSYIKYYTGHKLSPYINAVKKGYELTEEELKKFFAIATIDDSCKLIHEKPSYIEYYTKVDIFYVKVYLEALKSYEFSQDIMTRISIDSSLTKEIIKVKPDYIKYYTGVDEDVFQVALDNGYNLTEENIKTCSKSTTIMKAAIAKDIKYIDYYTGDDLSLYVEVLRKNSDYKLDDEIITKIAEDDNVMIELIQNNPKYINYYYGDDERVFQAFLNTGHELTEEYIDRFAYSTVIMSRAIDIDYHYIKKYEGYDLSVYIKAIKKGYKLQEEDFYRIKATKETMEELLTIDPNYIKYYKGNEELFYQIALDKGFELNKENIKKCSHSDTIMYAALEIDYNYIKYYSGENEEVFLKAISLGYSPTKGDIIDKPYLTEIDCIMEILIKKDQSMIIYYTGSNIEQMSLLTNYSKKIQWDILKFYKGNKEDLLNNYDFFCSFLNYLSIPIDKFLQYSFGSKYDWLPDMKKIYSTNIEEFLKVKNYFFQNYYNNQNDNVVSISNFLELLKNYARYPELCSSIINNKENLSDNEKRKIKYLFSQDKILFDNLQTIDDMKDVNQKIKNKYLEMLENSNNIDEVKNVLCQLLFGSTYNDLLKKLATYGNTMELKKLAFNDKNSKIINDLIQEMQIYTTMIEEISNFNDINYLKQMIKKALDNIDLTLECSTFFNQFEEKMRVLYENDIKEMLTNTSKIKRTDKIIDQEKSTKYGIEVLDFSDKLYTLLVHVRNEHTENLDDLINGKSSGKMNFICLSAISNRNQIYYRNPKTYQIIFGYDKIPEGSFIMSSISNMGSNGSISRNNSEVSEVKRTQRGVLETSSAVTGHNSELLMYREGLKPSCIILPGGREPTKEEIEIAKKYNLKFVITQDIRKTISNPKEIEYEDDNSKNNTDNESPKIAELKQLKEELLSAISPSKEDGPRKIAIFSDAHALFEPTLAILEDARKKGITEIYSLGDNIGTGPNPSEVIELLKEYKVKSIIGNHELYMLEGVEKFKEHLDRTHSYRKAKENSEWTREKLSEEQKERIKLYPQMITLKIGGKKLLLCHHINDYNTGKLLVNPEEFDKVLQGHEHFEKTKENVHTLSGAGIGTAGKGKAYYLVLTEKKEGGYDMEIIYVDYDLENVRQDINISTLTKEDKEKITDWSKIGKGR